MKSLLIIGIVLIILIVVGGVFVLRNRIGRSQTLTVFKDSGEVLYKPEGGEYSSIDADEFEIPNKSFVKTGEDGLAHVVLPDDSIISLSENSEMQINYDIATGVFQSLGSAWFRVQKLVGGAKFTVETPTAIAAVRGTIFGVERPVADGEEVSYVTDGSIEIAQLKEQDEEKVRQNSQELGENKLAKIRTVDQGAPEVIDIPEEKRQTPWFRRNEIINQLFKEGRPREFLKKLRENTEIKQIDEELRLLRESKRTLGGESDWLEKFSTYSWLQSGEACRYINSSEYQEAVSQIKANQSLFGSWGDWLLQAIDLIVGACSDGVIDANEAVEIQNFYQSQPQPNFSIPQN
ncbi:FecR domain-containing protein [Candidatus Woesebacteria bacterium]|nr:FecR domain-containing protein [Candidatus Woesebacteria bacterium]